MWKKMPILPIVYNKESPCDLGNEMNAFNICFHVVQVWMLRSTLPHSLL